MTGASGLAARRISVVVIGRNEGERLKRCLASIDAGVMTAYVDSNSTDGSADHARSVGAITVVLDPAVPFTAARARNAGAAALAAAGIAPDYLQFVDGDCEVEAGWLETAVAWLDAHPDVGVVCGRRRERFPDASVYNRLCDAEWNTPVGEAAACGGDSLMRRAVFDAVGGFDDAVVAGEEPELCRRIRAAGGRIWRIDAAMTIHDAAMLHLSQWWRRAIRSGFGYAQVWTVRRLYGREVARAIGWTVGLPLATALLALAVGPWALLALLLPVIQVARMALRDGGGGMAWARSGYLMLAKIPECWGIARFARQSRVARPTAPTSYK